MKNGNPLDDIDLKIFLPAVAAMAALMIALFWNVARADQARTLTASYYTIESLKKEGTWARTKGRMANGTLYREDSYTCATRIYPLGTHLRINRNGRAIEVEVTDRISKKYAQTRIDLTPAAFRALADYQQGLVQVEVKILKRKEAIRRTTRTNVGNQPITTKKGTNHVS